MKGRKTMKKMSLKVGGFLFCVVEIAVGVLLLIDAANLISMILKVFGVLIGIIGILSIIRYFLTPAAEASRSQGLMNGLVLGLVGFYCVFRTGVLVATLSILTLIFGMLLLIIGFGKLQLMTDSLRLKKRGWLLHLLAAAVSVGLGIVILINPFEVANLWRFIGIAMIVDAAFELLITFLASRKPRPKKEKK